MALLITGGAGYIGSITNKMLRDNGMETVVLDNLSVGHRQAVGDTPLVEGDLLSADDLDRVFSNYAIDAVVHFAAKALAGESMEKPESYYRANVQGSVNLLEAMRRHGVNKIVFSSTCAVYGFPDENPVTEVTAIAPVSVYGSSKALVEKVIQDYARMFGFRYAILRYFNACGATEDGSMGEDHEPESHLIPKAIRAALGQVDGLTLYGEDYPTSDGTCIRDYIHVADLAEAHRLALNYLDRNEVCVCNLGVGKGYSVRQVLDEVSRVVGGQVPVRVGKRREGDPAEIYAKSDKAKEILSWQPKYVDIGEIVKTAYLWHKNYPQGYGDSRG